MGIFENKSQLNAFNVKLQRQEVNGLCAVQVVSILLWSWSAGFCRCRLFPDSMTDWSQTLERTRLILCCNFTCKSLLSANVSCRLVASLCIHLFFLFRGNSRPRYSCKCLLAAVWLALYRPWGLMFVTSTWVSELTGGVCGCWAGCFVCVSDMMLNM